MGRATRMLSPPSYCCISVNHAIPPRRGTDDVQYTKVKCWLPPADNTSITYMTRAVCNAVPIVPIEKTNGKWCGILKKNVQVEMQRRGVGFIARVYSSCKP